MKLNLVALKEIEAGDISCMASYTDKVFDEVICNAIRLAEEVEEWKKKEEAGYLEAQQRALESVEYLRLTPQAYDRIRALLVEDSHSENERKMWEAKDCIELLEKVAPKERKHGSNCKECGTFFPPKL